MRFLLFLLLLVSTTTYAHGSSHAERCDSHREGITLVMNCEKSGVKYQKVDPTYYTDTRVIQRLNQRLEQGHGTSVFLFVVNFVLLFGLIVIGILFIEGKMVWVASKKESKENDETYSIPKPPATVNNIVVDLSGLDTNHPDNEVKMCIIRYIDWFRSNPDWKRRSVKGGVEWFLLNAIFFNVCRDSTERSRSYNLEFVEGNVERTYGLQVTAVNSVHPYQHVLILNNFQHALETVVDLAAEDK